MSNCTIKGCTNAAVAGGLCAMHYMRKRRRGDPEAAFKPGRQPKPRPEDRTSAALQRENAALRKEVAALKQRLAEAQAQARPATDALKETAIDPTVLAPSARQKLEAAVRQHKKNLDASFQRAIRAGIQKHINEVLLPMYSGKIAQAEKIISRTPPFTNKEFLVILRALHSDSTNEALRNEAFSLIKDREDMLRAPEPTQRVNFPKTAADLARAFASHNKGRQR